jgi:hypothetical protein
MAITLRRKPVDIDGWHLTGPADMMAAFTDLSAHGWRGGISADENGTLRLELNADNPQRQITAEIGDYLIDDMGLRLLTSAEAAANYDEVTD